MWCNLSVFYLFYMNGPTKDGNFYTVEQLCYIEHNTTIYSILICSEFCMTFNQIIPYTIQNVISRILTGIVVGICTLELVMDAGMATGMVWPLGSCKSTGKVPDTGLKEGEKLHQQGK